MTTDILRTRTDAILARVSIPARTFIATRTKSASKENAVRIKAQKMRNNGKLHLRCLRMRLASFYSLIFQFTNVSRNTATRSVNTATFWTRTAAKPVNASIHAKTYTVTTTTFASWESVVSTNQFSRNTS